MTTTLNPDILTKRGYRRISNKHGLVARIDRADWVETLLDHLIPWRKKRDCDLEREKEIRKEIGKGIWEDYYRRVLSKDQITIPANAARKIRTSDWDRTGYISYPLLILHGSSPHTQSSSDRGHPTV